MVNVSQSVYCEPQWTAEQVISAIANKESSDTDIVQHPDGVSFKKYGLTEVAVREAHNCGKLSWFKHPRDMNDAEQLEAALAYLSLMKERFHCPSWVMASGYYHRSNDLEKDQAARMAYSNSIRSRLERNHPA